MMSATRLLTPARGSVVAAKRWFAAGLPQDVPLPNVSSDPKPYFVSEYKTTTLPNGIIVASNDSSSPVGAVSVVVRAGSRQEDSATAGTSHYLRNLAFQSTKGNTAVSNVREAENRGIDLAATADRETITYSATFLKDYAAEAGALITDTVTAPIFYPWEVRAQDARVKLDLAIAKGQPQFAVLDDLQDAAFRGTLGRSILAPSARVGAVTEADLQAYTAKYFTADRIVVVGSGVEHEKLVAAVSGLKDLPASKQADKPAKFFGGAEVRRNKDLSRVQAVFAFQGAAQNAKDAAAFDVLSIVIGSAPSVQWSSASSSKVAGSSGFSYKYSDVGLFGTYLTSCPKNAEKNISTAAASLKSALSGGITAEDVARAKLQLIAKATEAERLCKQKYIANQLFAKKTASNSAAINALDAVTLADVQAAAKKALATKPVYVVRGKLDNVPYLDALF